MLSQSIFLTIKRYRTLQTHFIKALPVVILMPHSACNCQCVMCDIWKGNKRLSQLSLEDISGLLRSFEQLDVKQVVMSGGEALLNPNFFAFCKLLRGEKIKVTLLSTGISVKRNAEQIVELVNDLIVSLDGNEKIHDAIRNIPGAFHKLSEGIHQIRSLDPRFRITARTVIHRLNFRHWAEIIDTAQSLGLDQISFLPADVSSHAFNREVLWDANRQEGILIGQEELPDLQTMIHKLTREYSSTFSNKFIAESPQKIQRIYDYYSAFYGLNPFPFKKCNAPWVSTVIEADGTVRPCFFHEPIGNIKAASLVDVLNSPQSVEFRKSLNVNTDNTCKKCVCYLNLPPGMKTTYES
jgi:Fe-coproporphyrin III synthase